ncbi:MAG: hypothetical protein J6I49_00410 [Bacteroidales bacterium]|nr:hypothetical protein [Bacteroidales bacterium]
MIFSAALVACNPDLPEPVNARFNITTEDFNQASGAKVIVDRQNPTIATWDNGNEININGEKVTITVADGKAYVDADQEVPEASYYNAVYPDSIVHAINGDHVTINLPSSYSYRTDGTDIYSGNQHIHLPMAARSSNGNLNFKHLTGALLVHITNDIDASGFGGAYTSNDFYLERICVKCNHIIAGEREFDLSLGPEEALKETDAHLGSGDTVITMHFADRGREYKMSRGNDVEVLIPVPPVGDDNQFTIHVHGHVRSSVSGTQHKEITFSQRQVTGSKLERNKIAYVPITVTNTDLPTHATELTARNDTVFFSSTAGYELIVKAIKDQMTIAGTNMTKPAEELTYVLTDDINFEGDAVEPIQNFKGTFDGRNHTLKNITIRRIDYTKTDVSLTHYVGLFYFNFDTYSESQQPTVKDLTIDGIQIDKSYSSDANNARNANMYFGALCSYMNNVQLTLENCHVKNAFTDGITRKRGSSGTYSVCYGGLVGYINNRRLTISNSSYSDGLATITLNAAGNKTFTAYLGGLIGRISGGNISVSGCTIGQTAGDGIDITGDGVGTTKFGTLSGNTSTNTTCSGNTADIEFKKSGTTVSPTQNH